MLPFSKPQMAIRSTSSGEISSWRLLESLVQIDSEETAGMMWGDSGRIYHLIRKTDLGERRFDRTWAGLECM
jgi:uncharacterized protein YwqG